MRKAIITGLTMLFFWINSSQVLSQDIYETAFKLTKFLDYIDKYYVDTINRDKLTEEAIRTILRNLDPHSAYITPKEVKEANEPLQGNFEGIGITFNILDDTIFVISPIAGGPSERIGLLSGDRIVKVDGKMVAGIGITNNDVFSLLRGSKGTVVTVSVMRRNEHNLLDFTIVRDKIPIYSLDAAYIISENTGYIKLNRFSLTTMSEFGSALQKLKAEGANNLILDLSGNGGGYLEVAFELANEFLDGKKLIVYTQGVNSPRRDYFASGRGGFTRGNLVIIIDEGSASASEIVAGAVQDWDRGIIVGRRSFGKGLVQKPLPLPDQSELRLTVARYYTPTGRGIQKPYTNKTDYDMDMANRFAKGEFVNQDSIHFPDSLKFLTKTKQRVVYGGGGIMPDIFVPFDTTYYTDFYRDLIRKGILNRFILSWVDVNRSLVQQDHKTFDSFNGNFKISPHLFDQLLTYAEQYQVVPTAGDLKASELRVKNLMKAYIARDLWGNSEFYHVINTLSSEVLKALEVLEDYKL